MSDSVLRDNELINFCLSYLDGILEDSRVRVKFFLEIMNAFKDKMDLIAILFNFIKKSGEQHHRDIACHILVLLIDAQKIEKCEETAKNFVGYLLTYMGIGDGNILTQSVSVQRTKPFSMHAYTFALMTICKKNELAREISNAMGFKILYEILTGPCLENPQIAYNVVATLWILSYNDFNSKYFEDYSLGLIEKVTKVLDYFNTEKIVRILLMLIDNLKSNAICQEHLSDIDALSLVIKL